MEREVKEARVWKALELRVRILSRGFRRGAVMVLMLFEEAERDVREGKQLVILRI